MKTISLAWTTPEFPTYYVTRISAPMSDDQQVLEENVRMAIQGEKSARRALKGAVHWRKTLEEILHKDYRAGYRKGALDTASAATAVILALWLFLS